MTNRRPNEQVPQEQRDRLFLMLREAIERVADAHNLMCAHLPEGVSAFEEVKRRKPSWVLELLKIEEGLNSYDQTDAQYQALCDRYRKAWTHFFEFVTTIFPK
jgi:hypothetical protein